MFTCYNGQCIQTDFKSPKEGIFSMHKSSPEVSQSYEFQALVYKEHSFMLHNLCTLSVLDYTLYLSTVSMTLCNFHIISFTYINQKI